MPPSVAACGSRELVVSSRTRSQAGAVVEEVDRQAVKLECDVDLAIGSGLVRRILTAVTT